MVCKFISMTQISSNNTLITWTPYSAQLKHVEHYALVKSNNNISFYTEHNKSANRFKA